MNGINSINIQNQKGICDIELVDIRSAISWPDRITGKSITGPIVANANIIPLKMVHSTYRWDEHRIMIGITPAYEATASGVVNHDSAERLIAIEDLENQRFIAFVSDRNGKKRIMGRPASPLTLKLAKRSSSPHNGYHVELHSVASDRCPFYIANQPPRIRQLEAQLSTTLLGPYDIPVLVTDPEGDSFTISATGMPPGITFNEGLSKFEGASTPIAGEYWITVTAADSHGNSSTMIFLWEVISG
jgi:hypothetical protein